MFRSIRVASRACVSTLVLSLLCAGAARAQGAIPPGAAAAQPQSSTAAGAVELDAISVTSTKTEGRAIDVLGGASVVTRDQLNAIQPDRISDMLRQVPGVSTQENHNDPAQAINIRGLQDFGRVNVLVDGARQNFQTTGHGANGVFYLDPELVGGIDITRGPVATIYGSGAIGGVVAFRTLGVDDILKPDEQAGVVQKIGGGTNGYGLVNSSSFGVRLPNNAVTAFGQFVYRHNYAYQDGLGFYVPDTGSELVAGNVKVVARPAEGHEISVTALKQSFDFTNNGTTSAGARFADRVGAETYTLGYRFTPPGQPLFDLSLKGYFSGTEEERTFLRDSAAGTYTALGVKPGNKLDVRVGTYGFDVFNTSRFDTGAFSHALTYGGDGVFDRVRTIDGAGGFTGAFTPTGRRELHGAFVQDEIRAGWFRAVGAVRYDDYELSSGNFRTSGDRVSPRITVGVSPFHPGIEFFGTYAEGYRAPAISEALISGTHPFPAFTILPNLGLKPETAHNGEAGLNLKFDNVFREGDAFRAKLVGFRNEVDNFINIQGVGPTNYLAVVPSVALNALCAGRTAPFGPCQIPIQAQQYVNIPHALLTGFEGEAAYDWGDGFASVAYTHTEGRNTLTRIVLTTVPPDRTAATIGLRFLDRKLTLGTRFVFNSSRLDVPAGSVIPGTKEYAIADLFGSYEYNDRVRGDVTLSNIFDKRYTKYLDLDRRPGFQARGSLTIKFATR